jgi:hypothetical protein
MPNADLPPDSKPPSPRQVLLGLFILFQLAFLLFANLLSFVKSIPENAPDKPGKLLNRVAPQFVDGLGHGWQWGEQLENNLKRWWELTGQDQEWALFAPVVGKNAGLPCLLLLWDEMPFEAAGIPEGLFIVDAKNGFHMRHELLATKMQLLLSENEPRDTNDYFRIGKCRLRRYETPFYVNSQAQAKETPADTSSRMTRSSLYLANEYRELTLAYLQWRMNAWQREHSHEPAPKQVLLCERSYRIHDPDEPPGWDGPSLVPLIRWRPALDRPDEFRSLETFDFTERRFTL